MTLSELDNFHPEDGMILANTTSIGMQPKVDETPISKVFLLQLVSCRIYRVIESVFSPRELLNMNMNQRTTRKQKLYSSSDAFH